MVAKDMPHLLQCRCFWEHKQRRRRQQERPSSQKKTRTIALHVNDTYWYTFRLPPHAPGYFENEDFYSPFSKKHGSTRSIFKSFSPVHTKTLKRRKYYSIPHGACVMVVVYYLWHHRIRKRPSLPHSYINEEPAFSKISTLESVFWKDAFSVTVFNQKRKMISVDEALFSVHCTQRFRQTTLRNCRFV